MGYFMRNVETSKRGTEASPTPRTLLPGSLSALMPLSRHWCGRSRRVALLVVGVVILSLADLVITLAYLRANWMMEANPIAAYLIKSTQSAWPLAVYKCVTVGTCVALLYRLRRHKAGEVAAWCAVGILAVMSVMWHKYSLHFDDPQEMMLVQTTVGTEYRLGLP